MMNEIDKLISEIKLNISEPIRTDQVYKVSRKIYRMYDEVIKLFQERIKYLENENFLDNNTNIDIIMKLNEQLKEQSK